MSLLEDPKVIAAVIGAIAGLMGGLIAPFLKAAIEDKYFRRRLDFESSLTRQKNLIAQQASLLDNFARQAHKLCTLASKVTFYTIHHVGYGGDTDRTRRQTALEQYHKEGWTIFENLRHEIRKSRHLVSEKVYNRLLEFYKEVETIDAKILHIGDHSDDSDDMKYIDDLHKKVHQEIPREIDGLVVTIASEVGLSAGSYATGITSDADTA